MKKDMFRIGQKISTVFNWPVLVESTTPMHVLLEVVEGGMTYEKLYVPKTRAIGVSPITEQDQIIRLLESNNIYLPNVLRLHAFHLRQQLAETFEVLDVIDKTTVDVGAAVTEQAQEHQARIDRERQYRGVPFHTSEKVQ